MYDDILFDLKGRFGDKVILSPKDIAPIIDTSIGVQANQRLRQNFPIPIIKQGTKIGITIFALARWLADGSVQPSDSDLETIAPQPATASPQPSPNKRRSKNDWMLAMEDTISFHTDLLRELQRINLINSVKDKVDISTPPDLKAL